MRMFEDIWRKQCEATQGIQKRFGEEAALDCQSAFKTDPA